MTKTQDIAIWTEKYRPKDFDGVKGQDEIVKRVEAFVKKKNMPHLLFAGPAGVGKTTLALVIARKLFGEGWHNNFLELNASDERGIDVVRVKVKDFARTRAIGDVPFKIIYLDECDALTKDAQQALRRTMENYTQTCRFILSCVTPDTKILLPGNREVMVKEFINQYEHNTKQIHVQNISDNKESIKEDLVLAAVQLPASSIGKKVLEVTTMTGRKLKLTEDHRLLTINGWKEAGKMTKKDKLLIYPHIEGCGVEDNSKKIIDLKEFIKFLSHSEEQDGLQEINKGVLFRLLKSVEKEKILNRIKELRETIKSGKGLTEREFEAYNIIKQNHQISRAELQEKLKITRMGANYLMPSLEKKGYIKRIVHKKTHSFVISDVEPIILRNDMHIKKIIEKEFNIKISYTAVQKSINTSIVRGRIDRVIGELKRKELIDITYNNTAKIGTLARLCGFMLGDGHLVRNSIRLHFSGNKDALREVQKDLELLNYSNYSKIKSVTLSNSIRGRKFRGTSTSFTLDSRPLSLLLQYFGVSKGDKTITPYYIPKFIINGTKYVKREFLRALFGCDADKPKWKQMNCGAISLRQNKAKFLRKEMLQYYGQLSNLFKDFDVDTYVNIRDKKELRTKDHLDVLCFELFITPNNKNLFKFFSKIGYAYEEYKNILTRLSSEYLRHKLYLIEALQEKSVLILQAVDNKGSIREIARKFEVSPDFVANQIKGKDVHLARKEFMSFEDWMKKYQYNDVLVVNEIKDIKNINEEIVMDINCHKDHNFITNGLISHNCNYSSKIIDPIQSRCTVFRFKPLPKEDINKIIDHIARAEKLTTDAKAKEALYDISHGDCRRLENIMQSGAAIKNKITEELIYSVASAAQPKEIHEVLEKCVKGDFPGAKNKLLDTMLNHGLSGLDSIKQIQQEIWKLEGVDSKKKLEMIKQCGEAEFRMVEGSDEFIQLEALLSKFVLVNS